MLPTVAGAKWTAAVPDAWTCSPHLTHLDGDGVLDIVIGTGVEQMRGAVYAVSGATGNRLWKRDLGAEAYSTPMSVDVNGDKIADVVVAGRVNDVRAFDGKTASPIASLRAQTPGLLDAHFNTPIPITDVDGDGVADILVVQSGGNDDTRPPGKIHVLSARTLKPLWSAEAPDKREIYAVPAIRELKDGTLALIVGTGGETVGGSLHRIDVTFGKDVRAVTRWSGRPQSRGFVASPLWVEQGPGKWVAIGVSFDGVTIAADGESGHVLWEKKQRGFIVYASPSVGRCASQGCVVVVRSKGTSLQNIGDEARIAWFGLGDGKTIADQPLGTFAAASPLIVDLDRDGRDEVLAMTTRDVTTETLSKLDEGIGDAKVEVFRFEGTDRRATSLVTVPGVSGGTPALVDLDGNGRLDLIVPHGVGVSRFELDAPAASRARVDRYRGRREWGVVSLVEPSD